MLSKLSEFLTTLLPVDPKSMPAFQSDDAWSRSFQPSDRHADLLPYAESKYKEAVEIRNSVERKLEWFFTVAAGLSAVLMNNALRPGINALYSIPSLLCLAMAMTVCALARLPGPRITPPSIRETLSVADEIANVKAWQAQELAVPTTALRIIVDRKSRQLRLAVSLIVAGIFLLLLPLIAAG